MAEIGYNTSERDKQRRRNKERNGTSNKPVSPHSSADGRLQWTRMNGRLSTARTAFSRKYANQMLAAH